MRVFQGLEKVVQASRLLVSESKRDACSTFLEDLQFMGQVSELLNVPQASSLPKSDSQGRQDACDTHIADESV